MPLPLRWRPCSHIDDPPHSLHRVVLGAPMPLPLRWRPCSHIDDPPHSLHRRRSRPCSHIDEPPHSLHRPRSPIIFLCPFTSFHLGDYFLTHRSRRWSRRRRHGRSRQQAEGIVEDVVALLACWRCT